MKFHFSTVHMAMPERSEPQFRVITLRLLGLHNRNVTTIEIQNLVASYDTQERNRPKLKCDK